MVGVVMIAAVVPGSICWYHLTLFLALLLIDITQPAQLQECILINMVQVITQSCDCSRYELCSSGSRMGRIFGYLVEPPLVGGNNYSWPPCSLRYVVCPRK
jgi:hypothetical protein